MSSPPKDWSLDRVATFPGLRALAWSGDTLFASRGYSLLRASMTLPEPEWMHMADYRPAWWRNASSGFRPAARLFRDGFHALVRLSSGHLIAAVPGAIVTCRPGENEFRVSHQVRRGTRPLHITAAPNGRVYWGEYFGNPNRDEVHIYCSNDCGQTWSIAHTFPPGKVRHVHNIVYDAWDNCFWVLTGDNGEECRILRADCDFKQVEVVLSGNQQVRAAALVPAAGGVYFASDTPSQANHIYFLNRDRQLNEVTGISSSSIYGCSVGDAIFFSTMVEPSEVNVDRHAAIYGSLNGSNWKRLVDWKKDGWPMGLFQYGNAAFPDGRSTSGLLAVTTIGVLDADLETSLWRINV